MKLNRWTLALASTGVVSLASVAYAEEQAMSQVLTAVSSTTLSGYVDTSAIWKPGTGNGGLLGASYSLPAPESAFPTAASPRTVNGAVAGDENTGVMPGRAFDGSSKVDGFNLNVIGLTLEKPLSEDTWAAGYRADLLFGPDAVAYNPSVNVGDYADLAVKQGYVALRAPMGNGLDFKIGVFNTVIGYESFESHLNPNYSRSYGWQLEPTQHTGLLANYQFTEAIGIAGGIAETWVWGINGQTDIESQKTYMGSLTIAAPDSWGFLSGSALYGGFVNGFSGNTENTTSFYLGALVKTGLEGFSIGAAFDYREDGYNEVTPGDNWAWAAAAYLNFQLSEKWRVAARFDYTKGSDGTWFNAGQYAGYQIQDPNRTYLTPNLITGAPVTVGGPSDASAPFADLNSDGRNDLFEDDTVTDTGLISDVQNELLAVTLTADYALWANVITRAEFRWDTNLTQDDKPYGKSDENAVTVALNVIYKF